MAFPRMITVLAVISAVSLAGCGTADDNADAGAAGTPVASVAAFGPAVTWADEVCTASSALQESVRQATAGLQLDPTGPSTSLDQAKAQVSERVGAVQQSASVLDSAVGTVPAGADPELVTAQQNLRIASQRARTAVTQLGTAGRQVADAQDATELATALVMLKAALTATVSDVTGYLTTLRATVDSRQQAVRAAFGAAPACATVRITPSS